MVIWTHSAHHVMDRIMADVQANLNTYAYKSYEWLNCTWNLILSN